MTACLEGRVFIDCVTCFLLICFSNILAQTTVIMKCIQAEVLLKRGKDLNIHLISFVACIYIILQFFPCMMFLLLK